MATMNETILTPGDKVEVNFNGHWYAGTVAVVRGKRFDATFTTGSGRTRTKPFQIAGDRYRVVATVTHYSYTPPVVS